MKFVNALVLGLLLSGCAPTCQVSEGSITGVLTDVSWEGIIFKSCEIGIQIGGTSSKMDYSASLYKEVCDQAKGLIGQSVTINYSTYSYSGQTASNDIIRTLEKN